MGIETLDVDLHVQRVAELAHDARRRSAGDLYRCELINQVGRRFWKPAKDVTGFVNIEGDGCGGFPLRKRDVEHRHSAACDLSGETGSYLTAQLRVRVNSHHAVSLQQIICYVVAIVHAKVVDDPSRGLRRFAVRYAGHGARLTGNIYAAIIC